MVSISGISFSQNEYKKLGWLSLGLKILSHQVLFVCSHTEEETFLQKKRCLDMKKSLVFRQLTHYAHLVCMYGNSSLLPYVGNEKISTHTHNLLKKVETF